MKSDGDHALGRVEELVRGREEAIFISAVDPVIRHVIEQTRSFVDPGGELILLDTTADSVRVRYRLVPDTECADSLLAPDDLRQFREEMFARQIPRIVRVELEADET